MIPYYKFTIFGNKTLIGTSHLKVYILKRNQNVAFSFGIGKPHFGFWVDHHKSPFRILAGDPT